MGAVKLTGPEVQALWRYVSARPHMQHEGTLTIWRTESGGDELIVRVQNEMGDIVNTTTLDRLR